MKNKLTTVLIIVGLTIVIGIVTLILISKNGGGSNLLPFLQNKPTEQAESKENPNVENPTENNVDRTLKFDNKVTNQKKEDSYVDNIKQANVQQNYNGDLVDDYDFSNGFVIAKTDNIDITTFGFNDGDMVGASGAKIHIQEEDALKTTIQQLRESMLTNTGFGYYLGCTPIGIPVNTECDVEKGFTEWNEYYECNSQVDPAHTDVGQLLCDDIVDTAFGPALYIETYHKYDNMYRANAYILCERDRILSISIADESRDYLWSYLIELTNDGITLVK